MFSQFVKHEVAFRDRRRDAMPRLKAASCKHIEFPTSKDDDQGAHAGTLWPHQWETQMLDVILLATKETRQWLRRRDALRKHVRDVIVSEGGSVESITMIGMLLRSPFPPINRRPVYLKITCRYPKDTGVWYVCGTDNGAQWVWASARGLLEPPVEREYEIKVANNTLALPVWLSVTLYVMLVAGLLLGFAAFLEFT